MMAYPPGRVMVAGPGRVLIYLSQMLPRADDVQDCLPPTRYGPVKAIWNAP